MIWKTFVNQVAVTSRRRGLSTAIVYGLSLAVRFTSATGEEVEIPAQRTYAVLSIMTRGAAQLPYRDWVDPNAVQPIVFRRGWPPSACVVSAQP